MHPRGEGSIINGTLLWSRVGPREGVSPLYADRFDLLDCCHAGSGSDKGWHLPLRMMMFLSLIE